MLSYPVITSGRKAHRGSFENLLGDRYEELVEEMSLENQVDADTPPAFLWHTTEDDCVPVENSLLFYQALHDQGISVEMHIYPHGPHGLGLANELTAAGDGFWDPAEVCDLDRACQDLDEKALMNVLPVKR